MRATHLPSIQSWVTTTPQDDFSIHNFPFGIAKIGNQAPAAVSAIGQWAIRLNVLHHLGYFEGIPLPEGIFARPTLNDFIALGLPAWRGIRQRLSDLFREDTLMGLRSNHAVRDQVLCPLADLSLQMPVYVRDYTDFYSSEEHATNVGTMFRGKENALMPNWKHLPVGYHGRASSLVVSGTPVHRPAGQSKPPEADLPVYGPSRSLDYELEMGFIIGKATEMGQQLSTQEMEEHVFGMVLFNDWSARDLQAWEYVPLGPFLGKSFASSVSPWVVTMDALAPFRVPGPPQNPRVLPYLQYQGEQNYDIQLQVSLVPPGGEEQVLCRSNHKYLYWNIAQQLAHHTVNGCNLSVGDLMASGTISGPDPDSYGSMLELTWRGTRPVQLRDGSERKFLQDHDTVIMRGWCEKAGIRVGFGELIGTVLPNKG